MKKLLLAVALAPFALGFSMANAQTEVTTDPVGFVKIDLQPGLQTVGAAMVNPAVAAGKVASNNGSSIVLESEVGALDAERSYYLEVTEGGDGAFVGDRFEVASISGSTVAVDSASGRNTVDLSVADLTGYNVVIRPHVTLSQLLPTDQLHAGDAVTGDQVLFWDTASEAYEIHTLTEGVEFLGIPDAWQADGGVVTNDRVIAPGEGFFVRRRGEALELLTNIGEVRTNDFRQPIALGLNLIAEGHPLDNSPASRLMNSDLGFTAGDAATGDQILVFNPGTGGYNIYTYTEGVEFLGIPDSWQGDGGVVVDSEDLFAADGSVFFRKRGNAESDYTAPATF